MDKLISLLQQSSRTFALSIPQLPEPLQTQVVLGYLVFRLADTLEDEGDATPSQRSDTLTRFRACLGENDCEAIRLLLTEWSGDHPPNHPGYLELLEHGDAVCDCLNSIDPAAAKHIRQHASRTIDGMIANLNSEKPINDVAGVKRYCYHVAGIVGELLTELFILYHPTLGAERRRLIELSASFGEALQLVNILRDHRTDHMEGRRYVPDEQTYRQLLDVAWQDCRLGQAYLQQLELAGTDTGVIHFNRINLELAEQTLLLVQAHGPGVKVSRRTIHRILAKCDKIKLS